MQMANVMMPHVFSLHRTRGDSHWMVRSNMRTPAWPPPLCEREGGWGREGIGGGDEMGVRGRDGMGVGGRREGIQSGYG